MNAYALFFRDIALQVSIGIHDHERRQPQRYLVSVELLCRQAAKADSIDTVFDYDRVYALSRDLAASRHFDLQETFCSTLADQLFEEPTIEAVLVLAGKPDVYPDVRLVGCSIFRGADDAASKLMLLRGR